MKRFTLDWNCVISLETGDPQEPYVKELVDAHRRGVAEVALLQTSASENVRGTRGLPGSYELFEQRLRSAGVDDLPRVPTPGVYGLTFWDQCYWVEESAYEQLVGSLWQSMAPAMATFVERLSRQNGEPTDAEFGGPDFAAFRNAWCDVHSAYCHIAEGRDLFVTSNTRDFRNAGHGLVAVTPAEAVMRNSNS